METKILKLEGSPGKTENHYSLALEVPSKLDVLGLIERPPYHILSKNETTFSSGILAHVPHSIKLRISRDYQEPYIGLFIKLAPKAEELIEVLDVKGAFALPNSSPSRSRTSSTSTSSRSSTSNTNNPGTNNSSNIIAYTNGNHFNQNAFAAAALPGGNVNMNPYNANNYAHNHNYHNHYDPLYENFYPSPLNNGNNNNANEDALQQELISAQQKRALFNFFKSTVSKVTELDHYDYYESRCHWPDVATKLCIFIRVSKMSYPVIVNDETAQVTPTYSSMFNSEPFFMSEHCSDVIIKVQSTVFPAHKIILMARSKYFARMFSNQMRETTEGVVKIDDVEASLMQQLLSFIYLGKVEDINTYASDLLLLSDKYDIEELGSYCEKHLLDNLSVDNAIEMYDLSHTVGRKGVLAKKSKEIIMWNKDKFAADLDIFKEFSVKYPDLIFELLKL